jgi:hypothetical protein
MLRNNRPAPASNVTESATCIQPAGHVHVACAFTLHGRVAELQPCAAAGFPIW